MLEDLQEPARCKRIEAARKDAGRLRGETIIVGLELHG
jgi:hypothetical protein